MKKMSKKAQKISAAIENMTPEQLAEFKKLCFEIANKFKKTT